MNKIVYLKLANGNYSTLGSLAEISPEDVQFAVDTYNASIADKLLYYDKATGDVHLTDDVPTFMKGKLR